MKRSHRRNAYLYAKHSFTSKLPSRSGNVYEDFGQVDKETPEKITSQQTQRRRTMK